jgi:GH25 family lysozyme M1 (1,4-beta-N-acetylmuramidase)
MKIEMLNVKNRTKDNLFYLVFEDELKRPYKNLEIHLSDVPKQGVSHGISYLYMRQQYQEKGDVMGFDKSIAINERSTYGFNQGIKRK